MSEEEVKTKNRYIFPNWLAKSMSKVSFRAQMESSLLSMSLLVVAMFIMCLYMIFFGEGEVTYKVILAINLVCGFIFLSSYLITTYQQYKNYMDTMGIDSDAEREKIKASGSLFQRIKRALDNRKQAKAIEQNMNKLDEAVNKDMKGGNANEQNE